jgi:hypothetical protein
MSPGDIANALGRRQNNVKQLLFKMAKAGEVVKAARGKYIHPDRTDLKRPNPDNNGNPDNHEREDKAQTGERPVTTAITNNQTGGNGRQPRGSRAKKARGKEVAPLTSRPL